jgi:tetratricopeptide (TPR) repeat protein
MTAGEFTEACEAYAEALAQWRGNPLADVDVLQDHPAVARLRQQRADAVIEYAKAASASGKPDRALAQLRELASSEPLNERAHARLMVALASSGQQAAALGIYDQMRRRLDDELGVLPCAELADTQARVLRQDFPAENLAVGTTRDSTSRPSISVDPGVPRQLPASPTHFIGRAPELAVLNKLLNQVAGSKTVVISAIAGTAGVGKTALAVRFARQVAAEFPDGQLYVNLRGFGPAGAPMMPEEVIRGFLDALGVPAERVPAGLDAQAALYRSLLADRRIIVLLDNARDEPHVRQLLPGSPSCLVVITSRRQLTGLAATEGAGLLNLDLLSDAESLQLMAARLGPDRVSTEPDAAAQLVTLCARLPLALAITAARAVAHPRFSLAERAAELRDASRRLDALDTGDPAASIRAVLCCSYDNLSKQAAKLFRLLGLHPGPDISLPAAASLAAIGRPQARILLDELTTMHLLTQPSPARFAFHDLLRAYAAEQATALDSKAERHAAVHRVLDHYLHTAYTADRILNSGRNPIPLARCQPGATPERLATDEQAAAWFEAEYPVLRVAISLAAASGFDTHAWQIPWTLVDFLDWRGYLHEWLVTQRAALSAVRRAGDTLGQAYVHRSLGRVCTLLGHYKKSNSHLNRALSLHTTLGDLAGQADAHHALGHLSMLQSRCQEQLHHEQQALGLYQALGHRVGQANALNAMAHGHAQLGNHHEALACGQQALDLHTQLGNRFGQAQVWDTLGTVQQRFGDYDEAVTCYQQALELCGQLGSRYYQSVTLSHLGDCYRAAGETTSAGSAWRKALNILDDLDHPDAAEVRAKLASLTPNHTD